MNSYLAQICGNYFQLLSISQKLFQVPQKVTKEDLELLFKITTDQADFIKAGVLAFDDLKKATIT
jgi:hypothetical protein